MDSNFESDLKTLETIGITSIEELVSATAEFVRGQKLTSSNFYRHDLSDSEVDFLKRAGAEVVNDGAKVEEVKRSIRNSALSYAIVVATSLNQEQVAKYLKVEIDDVIRQSKNKSLYTTKNNKGITLYPKWQFTEHHSVIPGLPEILSGLDSEPNPVCLHNFFHRKQVDLEDDVNGQSTQFTPKEWLLSGRDVFSVLKLLKHL